jgi:hypothetical protein
MFDIVAAILAISAFMAFNNWRQGLLLCIAVGFIQDPIRKLASGQPGYFSILVIAVFALVYAAMLNRRVPMRLANLYGGDRRLKNAWYAFMALVVFQSALSFLNFGNPMISVLGLITYFAPITAMLVGCVYVRTPKDMERFFAVYAALAVPFALTVYLSYGYEKQWDVLKEIGAFSGRRLIIYDQDAVLYSYSGLLRVGEYAAWHAAMASIILFIFALQKRSLLIRISAGILIALLIGAILLTGRRKMLVALTIFLGVYTFLLAYFWYGLGKLGPIVIALCIAASAFLFLQSPDNKERLYTGRGATAFADSSGRFGTALDSLAASVEKVGFLGLGTGVTAQGAQHFGAQVKQVKYENLWFAEAGAGKIVVELGIPGVAILAWLLLRLARYIERLFELTPKRYSAMTLWLAALVAILVANAATFFVASQLYGDLFVLLLLGIWTGFLFRIDSMIRYSVWHEHCVEIAKYGHFK